MNTIPCPEKEGVQMVPLPQEAFRRFYCQRYRLDTLEQHYKVQA